MATRYHITITFPPGVSYYTDQWNVDSADNWTVQNFFDDMCAALNIDGGSFWLLKNQSPLIAELLICDSVSSGETVAVVAA